MTRTRAALALLLAPLVACEPEFFYSGYDMTDQFPLDGARSWEYVNESGDVAFQIRVEKVDTTEIINDNEVVTLETYNADTGDLLMDARWSVNRSNGVQIWGYTVYDASYGGGADASATYDPPLLVASPNMAPGESVTTSTGGATFTSTFVITEPCPNYWTSEWTDCVRMKIDDGDGDDTRGSRMAGEYWQVPRYGTSWFEVTGDPDLWKLRNADWEATN